ncbi:MAG: phage terminase large subunit [Oscillospiraceae bacterium]
MPNENNLIPLSQRTKSEQRAIQSAGGKASGEKRNKEKTIKQLVSLMLDNEITGKAKKEISDITSLIGDEKVTVSAAMVAGQMKSAMYGNTKAFEVLTDMQEKLQVIQETSWQMPITDITSDFVKPYREMHKAYDTGCWREFILKGGRGSIKSSFISEFALETILQDPQAHVVFTRRYKVDLRGSVYTQFLKTVTRLDMLEEWEFTTAPMKATYKKTGQQVLFVGCDKPISLKSYNLSFGHVKLLVNEEMDEMAGIEQLDSVEDTFLRQDVNSIVVRVFNPPKSANNWANNYVAEPREKCFVNHSYYYNTPTEWLGKRFFDRAEWFKHNKPKYYNNNYLGIVVGTGSEIFDNVEFRAITNEEMNTMGNFFHGLDFGYTHPQVFSEVSYNSETDTLYITNEVYKAKMKNKSFARLIKKYMCVEIIADSASPERIAEMSDYGFWITGASKGWGSRSFCWEWLQERRKIVIDCERTPCIAKEFRTLEFVTLADGTVTSQYPTIGEDGIMSIAYALNREMKTTTVYLDDKFEEFDEDGGE